jgi:peptidoglycan-associated lipoprotein
MNRLLPVVLTSLLAVSMLVAACAKRPALIGSTAPAPTAAAVTTPPAPAPVEAAPAAAPAAVTAAPVAPPPAPKEFEARAELRAIHFDFDKYAIRPGDAKILDANAEWLKSNPDSLVLIEGHCDERGTNEYNMALGDRRAKATMNYLLSRGVQSARMSTISYGEERPLCTEHNEACWSQNRRAELKVKPR